MLWKKREATPDLVRARLEITQKLAYETFHSGYNRNNEIEAAISMRRRYMNRRIDIMFEQSTRAPFLRIDAAVFGNGKPLTKVQPVIVIGCSADQF